MIIRKVRDDLRGWNLSRVIWVLDRGFTSERNRRYLQRGGGHYIVGEKLRSDSKEASAALARQGRYHTVAGNLRVKQVRIDDGTNRDRFVICHNPERADRDQLVREQILDRLRQEIHTADGLAPSKRSELYGALSTKPAYKRLLRKTPTGKLRIDRAAVAREAKLDGKFLLRTSDESLSAEDIAEGYKALYEAERGWRDLKHTIDMRPAYHRREDRIESHVQLCWLALLLLRVAETAAGDTWRNLRNELDRMHLVTLATNEGTVAQRTELTPSQRHIIKALELPEPPRSTTSHPPPTRPRSVDTRAEPAETGQIPAHTPFLGCSCAPLLRKSGDVADVISPTGPAFTLVEAHLLAGIAHLKLGDRNAAAAAAEAALAAAEPDRLMFPFAMTEAADLLDALRRHQTAHAAFSPTSPTCCEAERPRASIESVYRSPRSSARASCAYCDICRQI